MGAKLIYNEVNPCDASIMTNKRVANCRRVRDSRSKKHCLAIFYEGGQDKGFNVNVHLQAAWQSAREYKDALQAASGAMMGLMGDSQSCTIVVAGDLTVE